MKIRSDREPIRIVSQDNDSITLLIYVRNEDLRWLYKELTIKKSDFKVIGDVHDRRFNGGYRKIDK